MVVVCKKQVVVRQIDKEARIRKAKDFIKRFANWGVIEMVEGIPSSICAIPVIRGKNSSLSQT
jgi:hypothetical protein